MKHFRNIVLVLALALIAGVAHAADATQPDLFGIPVEFFLFAFVLIGVAVFHHHTLGIALSGVTAIAIYKITVTGFKTGPGVGGFAAHMQHEWVILTNLFLLLVGFALLSRHFEESKVPAVLPKLLPDDWKGSFVLLVIVFCLSAFLDNIAAAMIGGAMAHTVFRGKVHIGYLAAIVAASNAGGSGSVVGDTTTTMMWIAGVHPLSVLNAYVAAFAALAVFGIPAALQQHRYSPIMKDAPTDAVLDWTRVGIVAFILVSAISVNVMMNVFYPQYSDRFPFLGVAVWVALLLAIPARAPDWHLLPEASKGSIFLLALVTCASMMPVEKLPIASWQTALGLGFVSAIFDNIPLTALALKQGGYDWGMLAYTVGFGGSMIWFGSSAGVALSNLYPEARNAKLWLYHGWHVALAYVIGFAVMLAIVGWHPDEELKGGSAAPVTAPAPGPAITR